MPLSGFGIASPPQTRSFSMSGGNTSSVDFVDATIDGSSFRASGVWNMSVSLVGRSKEDGIKTGTSRAGIISVSLFFFKGRVILPILGDEVLDDGETLLIR